MAFPAKERAALLGVKGVGPKVIARLEEMGFSSLEELSAARADEILAHGAALTGASCWKNSPQARSAIEEAIALAKRCA